MKFSFPPRRAWCVCRHGRPDRWGLRGSPWRRARGLRQQCLLPLPKRPQPDTPLAEVLPLPGCRLVPHRPAVSRVEPQHSCPPLPRRGPQPSALLTSARSLRKAVPVASQHQVHSGHTFRRSSWAEWFHEVCPQGCGRNPAVEHVQLCPCGGRSLWLPHDPGCHHRGAMGMV